MAKRIITDGDDILAQQMQQADNNARLQAQAKMQANAMQQQNNMMIRQYLAEIAKEVFLKLFQDAVDDKAKPEEVDRVALAQYAQDTAFIMAETLGMIPPRPKEDEDAGTDEETGGEGEHQ